MEWHYKNASEYTDDASEKKKGGGEKRGHLNNFN